MRIQASRTSLSLALAAAFAVVAVFDASNLLADDRDILRESTTKPYLFVILDTSGSMNWAPRCTAADVADDTVAAG